MGILKRVDGEDLVQLQPAHTVGRIPMDVHLVPAGADSRVSRHHAIIAWELTHWRVRDISTNGTSLNGEVLIHADRELREGDLLIFGEGTSAYQLLDSSPPWTGAVPDDGSAAVLPEGNSLVIGAAEPLTLERRPSTGEWMEAGGGVSTRVGDGEHVVVDGRGYTLHLPQIPDVTVLAYGQVNEWTLRVLSSRRGQTIALRLESQARTLELGAHAHFGVIKVLAEERVADEGAGAPFAEQGWLHPQTIGEALSMIDATMRVHFWRVREALKERGFVECRPILEARPTGEVRIGCARVIIEDLG